MSYSSLWLVNKDCMGEEWKVYKNSWLFPSMVWDILADMYLAENELYTEWGQKKSLIMYREMFTTMNDRINASQCLPDRICWELSNQQIFFSKDKDIVSEGIKDFVKRAKILHSPDHSHIKEIFFAIAEDISGIDEGEYPCFVFKNNSVDDSVEYWFTKYDEELDDCSIISLKELEDEVTEFVYIKDNGMYFVSNLDYFK